MQFYIRESLFDEASWHGEFKNSFDGGSSLLLALTHADLPQRSKVFGNDDWQACDLSVSRVQIIHIQELSSFDRLPRVPRHETQAAAKLLFRSEENEDLLDVALDVLDLLADDVEADGLGEGAALADGHDITGLDTEGG